MSPKALIVPILSRNLLFYADAENLHFKTTPQGVHFEKRRAGNRSRPRYLMTSPKIVISRYPTYASKVGFFFFFFFFFFSPKTEFTPLILSSKLRFS